jgi:hypothetical protein
MSERENDEVRCNSHDIDAHAGPDHTNPNLKFPTEYRHMKKHCQEYSKESKINTFYTKVIFATRLQPTLVPSCFGPLKGLLSTIYMLDMMGL